MFCFFRVLEFINSLFVISDSAFGPNFFELNDMARAKLHRKIYSRSILGEISIQREFVLRRGCVQNDLARNQSRGCSNAWENQWYAVSTWQWRPLLKIVREEKLWGINRIFFLFLFLEPTRIVHFEKYDIPRVLK